MSQNSPEGMPPRQHFTVSLEQIHEIGHNGLPHSDHVVQKIEATESIDYFPYMFDADSRGEVQCGQGCARTGMPYLVSQPGIQAVNLFLERPLAAGEQTDIEYTTWFDYQAPPPPELRRQLGLRAMEKLDLTVRFSDENLPRAVWWTEWTGDIQDNHIEKRTLVMPMPVNGGSQNMHEVRAVRHNIAARTILGFTWEWH